MRITRARLEGQGRAGPNLSLRGGDYLVREPNVRESRAALRV